MVIFLLLLAGSCGDEGSQTTTITSTSPEESVSAGYLHTCEVKSDGTVVCWGNDEWGQATPPPGEFASVSAGRLHTCGVRTSREVRFR